MAVVYITSRAGAGGFIRCLAADTKPAATTGWTLFETDTGLRYIEDSGSWSQLANLSSHVAEGDPHPQYLTPAEGAAFFQPLDSILTGTTASFTSAQQTKLSGVATGATVNSSDAFLLSRDNHTGAQAISTVTGLQAALDGKQAAGSYQPLATVLTNTTATFTTAQETKLSGIATGATANSSDASLLSRSNHTGAQAIATITGLQAALDGKQASGSYQPLATVLTNTTASFTTAQETKLSGIATAATANASDAALRDRATHTGTEYLSQATPIAKTVTGTLTIAELLTALITCTSATAVSLTLPTGTLTDAGILSGALPVNGYFDWGLINLGSSTGAVTMVASTGHTIVGSAALPISTSATFRTRKIATNTFVTYRLR